MRVSAPFLPAGDASRLATNPTLVRVYRCGSVAQSVPSGPPTARAIEPGRAPPAPPSRHRRERSPGHVSHDEPSRGEHVSRCRRLPHLAHAAHRPLRAHHGPGLLGLGQRGQGGGVPPLLSGEPLRRGLRAVLWPRAGPRLPVGVPLHADGRRLSGFTSRQRRATSLRAGVSPGARGRRAAPGRRCGAGRNAGLPPRAPGARARTDPPGPARRDRPAQRRQLRDPHRHEGGASVSRRGRGHGDRIRPPPGAGNRRGVERIAGRVRRWLCGHLQRAGRAPLRHPGPRDPRAQLGDVVPVGAGGLRGLCEDATQQLRASGRHLRHAPGSAPRHRGRATGFATGDTSWPGSASTRATWPP